MSIKPYIAELLGTAFLVFLGCGSAVFIGCDPNGGLLAVAAAFGLALVAMAYSIGHVSGCHINPAVSLAMLLTGRMNITDFIAYIVAQVLGALLGGGVLNFLSSSSGIDLTNGLGANGFFQLSMAGALMVEILLTFVFVYAVLAVAADSDRQVNAGLIIGLVFMLVHIVGIPLTGTGVNPARSIGPAIFTGGLALKQLWVFILGPLAGSGIAAVVYTLLNEEEGGEEGF